MIFISNLFMPILQLEKYIYVKRFVCMCSRFCEGEASETDALYSKYLYKRLCLYFFEEISVTASPN